MLDNPNTAEPAKPRRWFQFRLRTLLIVVTLIAAFCPIGARYFRESERVLVADWVNQHDGLIRWSGAAPARAPTGPDERLRAETLLPEDFREQHSAVDPRRHARFILIPKEVGEDAINRIRKAFPEAKLFLMGPLGEISGPSSVQLRKERMRPD